MISCSSIRISSSSKSLVVVFGLLTFKNITGESEALFLCLPMLKVMVVCWREGGAEGLGTASNVCSNSSSGNSSSSSSSKGRSKCDNCSSRCNSTHISRAVVVVIVAAAEAAAAVVALVF